MLDPDLVVRGGAQGDRHGASVWAKQAMVYSRGARWLQAVLVDGELGAVLAPHGRMIRAFRIGFANGKIASIEVVQDAQIVGKLDLAVLE